jgi:polyisoprenyl-teichoic acid--peptidoglycan teichoic acid transferase
MTYPRRRLIFLVLVATMVVAAIPTIWIGTKWQRAISNVNKMIVTPVALPTATQQPQAVEPAPELPVAIPDEAPEPIPTAVPEPGGAMNILLVGTDARPGEEVSRTDTIVLAHFDPHTSRVSLLSFPRDLLVNVPGHGKNKINAAYPIGERQIGPGYGPALLKETVGELVGLPIDHFVLINFDGFKTLIDKIDGIYVDVPKALDDAAYPTDDYRTIKIHFDAGRQLLDGDRALIYARTRHADSDFGRNQRQQQVLLAIFDRVREQGLLSQLTNIDQYTESMSDYIRTDLSRSEMLSLVRMGSQLTTESIQRYAIDSTMVIERHQPAYVLVLNDKKGLKQMVSQMLDPAVASAGGETPSR